MTTQLQLVNISYHVIYHNIYHITTFHLHFSCFSHGLHNRSNSFNNPELGGIGGSKTVHSNIHIHSLKIDKKYDINCAWGIDTVGVSSGGAC